MSYSAYLIFREANKLQGNKNVKSGLSEENPDSVPLSILFSNSFLRDLDLIWELRTWIPDPTKPIVPPSIRAHLG